MRKIRGREKRGISPVIATMLLVSIALVLAVIIFLWARAFLTEKIQKDLGGGPELIEHFCKDVNFEVEAFSEGAGNTGKTYVRMVNRGNVPIHAAEVRMKDEKLKSIKLVGAFYKKTASCAGLSEGTCKSTAGCAWTASASCEVQSWASRRTIANGEDATIGICPPEDSNAQYCLCPAPSTDRCPIAKTTALSVVPIILGQKGTQYQEHVCDTEFAKETVVR